MDYTVNCELLDWRFMSIIRNIPEADEKDSKTFIMNTYKTSNRKMSTVKL